VTFFTNDGLNGSQAYTANDFVANVGLIDLVARGNLITGPLSTDGTFSQGDSKTKDNLLPGQSWKPWANQSGFESYETSSNYKSNVVQISWHYPSYSGYWYVYIKTVAAKKSPSPPPYKYINATYLYQHPSKGGYDP
jgi:hypothetical protein